MECFDIYYWVFMLYLNCFIWNYLCVIFVLCILCMCWDQVLLLAAQNIGQSYITVWIQCNSTAWQYKGQEKEELRVALPAETLWDAESRDARLLMQIKHPCNIIYLLACFYHPLSITCIQTWNPSQALQPVDGKLIHVHPLQNYMGRKSSGSHLSILQLVSMPYCL